MDLLFPSKSKECFRSHTSLIFSHIFIFDICNSKTNLRMRSNELDT